MSHLRVVSSNSDKPAIATGIRPFADSLSVVGEEGFSNSPRKIDTFAFSIWEGGIVAFHNGQELSPGEAFILLASIAERERERRFGPALDEVEGIK